MPDSDMARVRRTSQAKRVLTSTLVCALLVLCGQLARGVHMLLAQHGTCAEHGELVHLDGNAHAADALKVSPRVGASPGGESCAHDHCDALGVAHTLPQCAPPLPEASELSFVAVPSPVEQRLPVRSVLAFAPKTPPPSRA